ILRAQAQPLVPGVSPSLNVPVPTALTLQQRISESQSLIDRPRPRRGRLGPCPDRGQLLRRHGVPPLVRRRGSPMPHAPAPRCVQRHLVRTRQPSPRTARASPSQTPLPPPPPAACVPVPPPPVRHALSTRATAARSGCPARPPRG